MSILQSNLPPPALPPPAYADAQGLVAVTEASLQQSLLNLTGGGDHATPMGHATPSCVHAELMQATLDAGDNQDVFKQSIYSHPLFPLLALMFDKCEQASASPDTAAHGFEKEVQAFAKHHHQLKTHVLVDDEEVNELMLKSIQVLRIHLMEVEKVTELCRDFCTRYISCLKSKLTSESLLHVEGCDSPPPGDMSGVLNLSPTSLQAPPPVMPSMMGGNMVLQQQQPPSAPQQPQIVSGNTVYQMVHTPQGIVAQPIQISGPLTPLSQPQVIHGSTPLSQIGLTLASPPQQQQQQPTVQQPQQQQQQLQQQPSQLAAHPAQIQASIMPVPGESQPAARMLQDMDDDDKNGKQKRGVLPKQATQVMKSWLFQHIVHPYPTEDEKRQMASQTNLTLLQVNNWFINARRRILQPMLEASNPDQAKAKKVHKPSSKPPQNRFWPSNLDNSANNSQDQTEKAEPSSIKPEPSTFTPTMGQQLTNERLQPVSMTMEAAVANQSEALMGYLSNGMILKVNQDGQVVPTGLPNQMSQMSVPAVNLESLQTLQALQGSVFAQGPTSLPLGLPMGLQGLQMSGLGLGMSGMAGMAAFPTLGMSPMTLGGLQGLQFGGTFPGAPLQLAHLNQLNPAPIDLSAMSSAGHIQVNPFSQQVTNGQVLMSLPMQQEGMDMSQEDSDTEAGELKVDMSRS